MTKQIAVRCLLMFSTMLSIGCDDAGTTQKEVPVATAKSLEAKSDAEKPAAEGDAAGMKERNFDGAIFQVPATWEESPRKSDFITAEFQVTGSGGPARLTLSTAGGDVASNIQRWRGQFTPSPSDPQPKESTLTVDGKDATLVELFGTFRDGFSGDSQPNGAMLGVVIPLQKTNYFVKLTGPQPTLTEARDAFLKFVETAKFNQ
jgi:hypothetical protein